MNLSRRAVTHVLGWAALLGPRGVLAQAAPSNDTIVMPLTSEHWSLQPNHSPEDTAAGNL